MIKINNRWKRVFRYSLIFLTVLILVLIWFYVEGTVSWGDNFGEDILYLLLCFFAFPVNWIFELLHVKYGISGFITGAVINCFFYGFISERIVALCRKLFIKKKDRQF